MKKRLIIPTYSGRFKPPKFFYGTDQQEEEGWLDQKIGDFMNKLILIIALSALIVGLLFVGTNVYAKEKDPKVRICHSTSSHQNPYSNNEVDPDAVDGDEGNDNGQGDHTGHNGSVWEEGIESWGDIIPPIEGVHEGKNWNEKGQAFWNNACNKPLAASPDPSPSADPSPSIEPSPTASASATPSPTIEPTPSPSPIVTPQPTSSPKTESVEQQQARIIEEIKKENGGVVPEIGFK